MAHKLGWTDRQWDKVFRWYEDVTGQPLTDHSTQTRQMVNLEWQKRKGSLQP